MLEVVETSLVALPAHALAAMDGWSPSAVSGSPWTTSAPATRRWRGSRSCPPQIGQGGPRVRRRRRHDPADFAVAQAVVDMAKAMGRSTVAEGVGPTEQFHVLRGVGVDAYQGWLFARPLPPEQVRALPAGRMAVQTSVTGVDCPQPDAPPTAADGRRW